MRRLPAGTAGVPPASHRGWHYRGYLPHFDAGNLVQMITYRLADSLPAGVAESLLARADDSSTRRRAEALLDAGHGSCCLSHPQCARIVVDAWRHFDGQRYRLHAWVVMSNHVHVVLSVFDGHPLPGIVHSQKSYTAHRLRRIHGGREPIWSRDYWVRYIRDDAHFLAAVEYVEENPVRAGLARRPQDWPWSSASALRGGRDARGPRSGGP